MAPIEVVWEGNNWLDWHMEVVGPAVDSALELATDGLAGFGIATSTPKRISLLKVDKRDRGLGLQDGDQIQLKFTKQRIKRLHTDQELGQLAATTVHELVHSVRGEVFPTEDGLEFAATEGLAHLADIVFGVTLNGPDYDCSWLDSALTLDEADFVMLWSQFFTEQRSPGLNHREFVKKWFFDSTYGHELGMICVSQFAANEGLELPELMQVPADILMDIRS